MPWCGSVAVVPVSRSFRPVTWLSTQASSAAQVWPSCSPGDSVAWGRGLRCTPSWRLEGAEASTSREQAEAPLGQPGVRRLQAAVVSSWTASSACAWSDCYVGMQAAAPEASWVSSLKVLLVPTLTFDSSLQSPDQRSCCSRREVQTGGCLDLVTGRRRTVLTAYDLGQLLTVRAEAPVSPDWFWPGPRSTFC